MNPRNRYILGCLAVGVLSVTFLAVVGFWARWMCFDGLSGLQDVDSRPTRFSPMGLLPDEVEEDPEVVTQSEAVLTQRDRGPLPHVERLGIRDDFYQLLVPEAGRSDLYRWESDTNGIRSYFNRRQGLFVYSRMEKQASAEGKVRLQRVWLYAGPEGIAETPDRTLGRFRSPIVNARGTSLIVYDAHQRRFFRVDFNLRDVTKGPQLDPGDRRRPIQIGAISKYAGLFSWRIEGPRRRVGTIDPTSRPHGTVYHDGQLVYTFPPVASVPGLGPYALVLDASGRIDLLDRETLEFAGPAGALSRTSEPFARSRTPATPKSLLAYDIRPILTSEDGTLSGWEYRGLLAGTYNYDGSFLTLEAYDSQGSRVATTGQRTIASVDVPGGPMIATIRFLLESVHPPVLSLLSYFTAPYCSGGSGYRSIFVLPDSYVAMKGRHLRRHAALRFTDALVIMLPAIALVCALSVLVARDAQRTGLSKDARTLWVLITIAFGLPAYVTYRLTRPGATLVTCANCGKPRRPDLDLCHHCNSPWTIPELDPPAWRVLDATRMNIDESPPPKEAATD